MASHSSEPSKRKADTLYNISYDSFSQFDTDQSAAWCEALLTELSVSPDKITAFTRAMKDEEVTGRFLLEYDVAGLKRLGLKDGAAQFLFQQLTKILTDQVPHLDVADIKLPQCDGLFFPEGASVLKQLDKSRTRSLINRSKAETRINKYIDAVIKNDRSDEFMSKDGKGWKVCGTVGASGMGKSALLEKVAIEQSNIDGRRVLFTTFNTKSFFVPLEYYEAKTDSEAVARSLLHAAGAEKNDVMRLGSDVTPTKAIEYIRKCYKMQAKDPLIVFFDELLQLGDGRAQGMVTSIMQHQDQDQDSTFVAIFSSFAEKQLHNWTSTSGRAIFAVDLEGLDANEVKEMLATEAVGTECAWLCAWLKKDFAQKVLNVLSTHPRSVFSHLPNCDAALQTQSSVATLVSKIFEMNERFEEPAALIESQFFRLLTHREVDHLFARSQELREFGFIQTKKVEEGTENLVAPFMVRMIAYRHSSNWSGRIALRAALDADLQVTKSTRVRAESVVQNFEALLRLAFARDDVTLDQLFRGASFASNLEVSFKLFPANMPKGHLVREVSSFSTPQALELLRQGHIVVSDKSNEAGIEHITPLFDDKGELTAVLVYQIKAGKTVPKLKLRSGKAVDPDKIASTLLHAAKKAGSRAVGSKVQVIPVLMCNSDVKLAGGRWKAVQMNRGRLHEWLRPLIPLQMVDDDSLEDITLDSDCESESEDD